MKYMAIDQYGETVHGLTYPRKELCERWGTQHARKVYRDTSSGPVHVGYCVCGHWYDVYRVLSFKEV